MEGRALTTFLLRFCVIFVHLSLKFAICLGCHTEFCEKRIRQVSLEVWHCDARGTLVTRLAAVRAMTLLAPDPT
jgi:hypothetical protein